MKIFISIASYQDALLPITINSAYTQAKFKDNISFGVIDQSKGKLDFSKSNIANQITYLHLDPKDARGPCWARAIAQTFINDESYFLQVDSHTVFEKDWDEYLLNYIKIIKKNNRKPIISSYPRGFEVVDMEKRQFRKLQENDHSTHVMVLDKDRIFKDGYFSMQKGISTGSREIYKGFLLSAGFIFCEREYINDVPYDPHLYFEGEETTLALRTFTSGYDIFHIPKTPLFHCYVAETDQFKRPLHWHAEEEKDRKDKWNVFHNKSKTRINNIIEQRLLGPYGLGKERTLEDYKNFSGIDILNKRVSEPDTAFHFKKYLEGDTKSKTIKRSIFDVFK